MTPRNGAKKGTRMLAAYTGDGYCLVSPSWGIAKVNVAVTVTRRMSHNHPLLSQLVDQRYLVLSESEECQTLGS